MGAFIEEHSVRHLLDNVKYNQKNTAQIRTAIENKVSALMASIERRNERIVKLRAEHNIDAEQLASLLVQHANAQKGQRQMQNLSTYDGSPAMGHHERSIPAGAVSNIAEEHGMIVSEKGQLRKMRLVLRNLQDEEYFYNPQSGQTELRATVHKLSDDELEYLGF